MLRAPAGRRAVKPRPTVRSVRGRFGIKATRAERIEPGGSRRPEPDTRIVHEDVLVIDVERIGSYSLMWTPTADPARAAGYSAADGILTDDGVPEALALAAGFVFTEGIVGALSDIDTIAVCADRPDVVRIRLTDAERSVVRRRNVVINSSCGICGGREQLDLDVAGLERVPDSLRMTVADLAAVQDDMRARQDVFAATGGAHAAAVFDAERGTIAIAEDLGRHNALDKVIGHRLLAGLGFARCGVFLSSRISYEMAMKSARAGFELVAAVSAPSSLAIETADRAGITLCGFVRNGGAVIYTHPHRIVASARG
jgi:FdhD protein